MSRTAVIPTISRKLAPFVVLFGCYLITHGHLSPGGGFQGGTVLASGFLLLLLGYEDDRSTHSTSSDGGDHLRRVFHAAEAIGFFGFLCLGLAGIVFTAGFLADPFPAGIPFILTPPLGEIVSEYLPAGIGPHPWFIFLLNLAIGLKVGSGISLVCITLLTEER
jgi:multicomponent Na+:H+ antiporter subunit B